MNKIFYRTMSLFLGCFFLLSLRSGVCADDIDVESEKELIQISGLEWTVKWQGMLYTGVYTGESLYGQPEGNGEFSGYLQTTDHETKGIEYNGEWESGQFEGEGKLTDLDNNICYEGEFEEGKLSGEVKEYSLEEEEYFIKSYEKDIPIGVSWVYDEDEKATGYDYYFKGISVNEIKKNSQQFKYQELLYNADDYKFQKIELECRVEDILSESPSAHRVKVKDNDDNIYILKYDLLYNTKATNFMPFLKEKDEIIVYGYCQSVETWQEEEGIEYPCIEAVTADYKGNEESGLQNLSYEYANFLDYPYLFKTKEVKIEGEFKGVYKRSEQWIYFLVESDSYSKGEPNIYICGIRNRKKNLKKLPLPGETITLQGKLNLNMSYVVNQDEYDYHPAVKVSKIQN